MATRAKAVTDIQVRAWSTSRPKSAQSCGGNLYFRAHTGGIDQWYFRYSLHGKARWMFLGNYPDKSLKAARQDAARARVGIDDGKDVSVIRQQEKLDSKNAQSVAELANAWFGDMVEPRIRRPDVVRSVLDNHILPKIGALRLDHVRPIDVERVLKSVRHRYPTVANKALIHMRKIFRFGLRRGLLTVDPVGMFEISDAGGFRPPRTRVLSAEEISKVFLKMRTSINFGRQNELATKLLLALCVRKMELLAAMWDEFDLTRNVWILPGERTKTGQPIAIPLTGTVVEWLQELKVLSARSPYVFPARRITKQRRFNHTSPDTLNLALKTLNVKIQHFTVHDLRRTARTHLSSLKVTPHIAERALNHKIKGVEGVYDLYQYFDERKEALSKWNDRLMALDAGDK